MTHKCDWVFAGGRQVSGCPWEECCVCSVPVYECSICGGCDYGLRKESIDEERVRISDCTIVYQEHQKKYALELLKR